MARKRLVSPQFFVHGDLFDAESKSGLPLRVAFAGLWCQADKRGIFAWRPRELKLAILPYDALDFGDVLERLREAGFVERYEEAGQVFGLIPSFSRWQTFHCREVASDCPAPPGHPAGTVPTPGQHGVNTAVAVTAAVATSDAVEVAGAAADAVAAAPRTAALAAGAAPPARLHRTSDHPPEQWRELLKDLKPNAATASGRNGGAR